MKSSTSIFLLGLILLISKYSAKAQTNIEISGKVTNEKDQPLEFATVSLLQAQDSTLLKTTLTDNTGKYQFQYAVKGDFLISISSFGYKKFTSKTISTGAEKSLLVPPVALTPETKTLKEVKIIAEKPFIERKADKLIVNVEGSAAAAGNTALEVLKKAPGVSLDKDDNISMNGKNSVLVMLDGKPTYMSNADLANMLRSMQSDQIETIELITNPSAKYDAAGNGGIINIKTKRNKNLGFNGSATLGSGYGKTSKYTGNTSVNFRKNKVNVFGNYNYSNRGNQSEFALDRQVDANGEITNFDQDNSWNSRRDNNGYKVGIDYFVTKNTTIGLLANGYNNLVKDQIANGTLILNKDFGLDSSITVAGRNRQRYRNGAYNFNLKTTLDTLGRELSFDADYSDYTGKSDEFRDSYFRNFEGNPPVEHINNLAPAKIEIMSAKLDYTHPFSKTLKMEAGWKSSWVTTDNDFKFLTQINSNWISDKNRSNHFVYKENINAAYLNLNKEFKTTTLQVGLRGEQTLSTGNSITLDKVNKRNYLEFFPSVSVSQKLSKNHQVGASFSRRIDRPNYGNLNPFIFLLDKYTYEQGNPDLQPQYTQSAELSYTYKGSATASLGYSQTNDVMSEITEQNDETKETFVKQQNLNTQTVYSFNIYAPIPVNKWWRMNNNIQVFNLGVKAELLGSELESSQTVFQINTDNQLTITKTFGAEFSGRYMSPMQYGIFHIKTAPYINAGLKKSFKSNKLNLKLSMNDIFNTQRNQGSTTFSNMNFKFSNKWESQVANFSISYRFGSNDVKPERRRSTGLEAEANRMNN